MIGALVLAFAWWMRMSMKVDIFLELVVIIFYVILPHTFLMNTAYNKERIIDEGLKNIIRNALDMPFDRKKIYRFLQKAWIGDSTDGNGNQKIMLNEHGKENCNSKDTKTYPTEKDVPIIHVIPNNELNQVQKLGSIEDCENRKLKEDVSKGSIPICQISQLPEEKPSSSKRRHDENEHNKGKTSKKISERKEKDVDEEELTEDESRLLIYKKLLNCMFENLNDEKHYLHYFLQLIDYEDKNKDKNKEKEFVILSVIEFNEKEEKKKMMPTKKKGMKNSRTMKNEKKPTNYQVLSPRTMMFEANANQKQLDRTAMRRAMMENFEEHLTDKKSFSSYLNELIDFEEGLIDN